MNTFRNSTPEDESERLRRALIYWSSDEWNDEPHRAKLAIADIKRRLEKPSWQKD